jgi:hypothetical protein
MPTLQELHFFLPGMLKYPHPISEQYGFFFTQENLDLEKTLRLLLLTILKRV